MTEFVIEVPMAPPSLNIIKRTHHFDYGSLRKSWEQSIVVATGSAAVTSAIRALAAGGNKIAVTITEFRKGELDPDNLYGSVKVILDALQNVGFLKNDKSSFIDLEVKQLYGKGSTVIKLRDTGVPVVTRRKK